MQTDEIEREGRELFRLVFAASCNEMGNTNIAYNSAKNAYNTYITEFTISNA